MASIIRVKRSTGTTAPSTLNYGELALTIGSGSQGNKGERFFVGNSSNNPIEIGGKYYTDLLDHVHGTLTASSAVIVDSSSKIDVWNVDNLRLDGNALTSTDTDGNITITPNGTGRVQFLDNDELQFGTSDDIRLSYDTDKDAIFFERGEAGATADIRIADDIHFQFGTDNDARIYYDEATSDKIQVEGADWNFASGVAITISDTTGSTSKDTGALVIEGGVGIEENLFVGGNLGLTGITTISDTTDSTSTTTGALVVAGGVGIGKTVHIGGDLNVEGGDVNSTNANLNLFDVNVTTANVLGDGSTIALGTTTGTLTLRPNTVVGVNATQNLYDTVATTVNAFGAATSIDIGATSGTLTINNPTVVGSQTTQELFNTTATKVDAFGAATNIVMGATTGVATIRNATVDLDGDLNVDGGDLTSNQTSFNLLNSTVTEANVLGAGVNLVIGATTGITTIRNDRVKLTSTQDSSDTTSGALVVDGGVGIAKTLNVGGALNVAGAVAFTSGNVTITNDLIVNGNTTLGNSVSDTIDITGDVAHVGEFTNTGGVVIDNVGIKSNMIFTQSGGGNQLFIDPFPDGLSNEGTVIIKGDLQVDGTTTTVNSSSVSVNEAILNLGDVSSVRTVMTTVGTGSSEIVVDSLVGINTGDLISGSASLPGAGTTTVHSFDSGTNTVRIDGVTSAGIVTTTQLTVTHAFDTSTDRGVSFDYNTSSGISNNKVGFFGFDDSSIADSSVTTLTNGTHADGSRRWTYIPDASITNSVVSGTKGFLDVKGIYYQSGDFDTNGVVFFDDAGLQRSTNNPSTASNTRTSTQILTAVTEVTLDLPSSTSVTAGDQITQLNNSSAYGVVKTTSSGTTITIIGVQGTFDTTNDLKVNGTNISIVPDTVTTVYTNKPTWTDTIDGGTF